MSTPFFSSLRWTVQAKAGANELQVPKQVPQ